MTFEELKKLLQSLTDEQKTELTAMLNASNTGEEENVEVKEDTPKEEVEEKTEVEETEVKAEDGENNEHDSEADEQLAEEKTEEVDAMPEEEQTEEIANEAVETAETTEDIDNGENSEETPEIKAEEQVDDIAEEYVEDSEEDIPAMNKTAPVVEGNVVDEENGEPIPLDYQNIIDGMNAKTLALEAENRQLKAELEKYKSKVDGAFGFSAKPPMPGKVNKLYDDCENIRMHK